MLAGTSEITVLVSGLHLQFHVTVALNGLLICRNTMDSRPICRTFVQPAHRESMWIVVEQRGRWAPQGVEACQVGCEGRFSATAFGVDDDDLVEILSVRCLEHSSPHLR